MRVLYCHQHFSTPSGSTGTRSYEMARALVAAGHEVVMVCGSYWAGQTGLTGPFQNGVRRGKVEGIEVIELELDYSNADSFLKRTLTFLRFSLASVGIALREPCDVIFATTTPLTAGIPGIVARWLQGKRFVFEVRDLWPELPKAMGVIKNPLVLSLMSGLEWLSYRSAHACIGLSPGIVEGIRKRSQKDKPIAMIPNGSDLYLFEDAPSGLRPEECSEKDFVAVFTGTHGVANGLDAVLDVAQELKHRGRDDIKFVFIGDGKSKPALVQRASNQELSNCIFMGLVPKTELVKYLAGADVGLMILANVPAFYYGTSPNKFFDYIAAGLPVLCNYPGWLAEMIQQHDIGVAVPPEKPELFADGLEQLADRPDESAVKRRNAKALASTEFDRSVLAKEFVSFLEEAVSPT
jgi:glycosyltransferase involved in cell wall biosynthesis